MILTLTPSPTVDFSAEVPALVPDRKLRAGISAFQPGGGGVNVSRVLHDLGIDTTAVVAVGGLPGEIVVSRLADLGIDTVAVLTREDTRWAEMLRDRSTGLQYRIIADTPALADDEWKACVAAVEARMADPLRPATHVVLSGSIPHDVPDLFIHELAQGCAGLGVPFVVDTSGPALAAAVDAGVDLIKPSRGELAALTGVSTIDLDHVVAARELVHRGVGTVIVSLGPDGAFVASTEGEERLLPPPEEIVSTVGGGDAMVAGILAGLVQGRSMLDSARFGVALASATCLTPAGHPARTADVERIDALLMAER